MDSDAVSGDEDQTSSWRGTSGFPPALMDEIL